VVTIYAALFGPDGSRSADGADGRIAGYQLEIDGEARGRVEFYAADVPKPSEDVAEVKALDDECVAKLLAEAVEKLKSETDEGDLDEPALEAPSGTYRSAGIVLVDERGHVTIREPANHYGGYVWSYAKGRMDPGETAQQTARRELGEETGLTGRVLAMIGDFKGDTSVTRLYVGVRTGGDETTGPETWSVKTVSSFTAFEVLNKPRDRAVLVRLVELAAGIVGWSWTIDGRCVHCRVVDGRMVCSTDTSGSESPHGGPTTQARDGRHSSPVMLSDRFEQALQFAAATHRTQIRKGSGIPYMGHLLGVCSLVIEDGGSEDEAIGALLHDAAEDLGGQAMLDQISARFGAHVARIVEGCTDTLESPKPRWCERKRSYLEHLKCQPDSVLRVSLADKLFNARAILRDYLEVREALWPRFKAGREGQLWYYRQLADRFKELLPGRMAEELSDVIAELERVAITD
jgi:8-oxo-dGTP pyrophosphatase MutT (NUDIX family)